MPVGRRNALASSEVGCSCSQSPRVPCKHLDPAPLPPPGSPGVCLMPEVPLPELLPVAFLAQFPAGSPRGGGPSGLTPASETSLGARVAPTVLDLCRLGDATGTRQLLHRKAEAQVQEASTEVGSFKGCLLFWGCPAACLPQIPSKDSTHCPRIQCPTCPPPRETSCECSFLTCTLSTLHRVGAPGAPQCSLCSGSIAHTYWQLQTCTHLQWRRAPRPPPPPGQQH